MLGTGITIVSDSLGISRAMVNDVMKGLIAMAPPLLDKKENGFYYPSTKWYLAHWERTEASQTQLQKMASDVIAVFNEINGTRYSPHTYETAISAILKSNPQITIDHFRSVIAHKNLTWETEDKMSQYNRPATIFSRKFMVYLDEAHRYWLNKAKDDFKPV